MVAEQHRPSEESDGERSNVVRLPVLDEADHGDGAPLVRDALGEVLREERLAQKRTLVEVGEAAWVSTAYLSEIERGRKEASSEVLRSIADALEVPVPVILERTADRLRVRMGGSGATGSVMLLAA